jgi:hypothetical protein
MRIASVHPTTSSSSSHSCPCSDQLDSLIFRAAISRILMRAPAHTQQPDDISQLSPADARARKREWNRGPLTDLFPRIPPAALERVLDLIIDKAFTYNLSLPRLHNARRYTSIVVAHVRHRYSDYDRLLRDRVERYDARKRSAAQVWHVLRTWCPWDADNEVLERCFRATLLTPEERDPSWDPMEIDDDHGLSDVESAHDDPMDLD